MSWIMATIELKQALIEEHMELHMAELHKTYEDAAKNPTGKKWNAAAKAIKSDAMAYAMKALFEMDEYNGVRNPAADDTAFGRKATPEPTAPASIKANKYGGKCPVCNGWVDAEAGKLVKVDGKWGAEHIKCPEPTTMVAPKGLDLSDIQSGYYAVPDGDTRLKVRIAHGKEGSKWEGYTFVTDGAEYGQQVRYGTQRPEGIYTGKIQDKLEVIVANPQEAMRAYGRLVGQCGACGRLLENEASIEAGIGSVCASKGMFA